MQSVAFSKRIPRHVLRGRPDADQRSTIEVVASTIERQLGNHIATQLLANPEHYHLLRAAIRVEVEPATGDTLVIGTLEAGNVTERPFVDVTVAAPASVAATAPAAATYPPEPVFPRPAPKTFKPTKSRVAGFDTLQQRQVLTHRPSVRPTIALTTAPSDAAQAENVGSQNELDPFASPGSVEAPLTR